MRLETLESRDVPSAVCDGAETGLHVHLTPDGREVHKLSKIPNNPPPFQIAPRDPPFALADTFKLHSRPTANHVIYLDFDGHITSGTSWNTTYNGGADFTTPAYSFEGTSSFSNNELERIQLIFQRVMEAYSPFDVDVTTEFPGLERLRKLGAGDTQWGIRVVIGGNGSWFEPGIGGVAFTSSFDWSSDTPCFIFEDNLTNGHEKLTADAATHETGHTLGLSHDGRTSPPEEYYEGHGSGETGWAPIMGVGYDRNLVQWSKGEYPSANETEDDLNIITTTNGFGYRTDDHGGTQAAATNLTEIGSNVEGSGVIEQRTDFDYFRFTTAAGNISLSVNAFTRAPMLDVLVELYNSSGVLVTSANPVDALSASLTANVAAGVYFLKVDGVGKGNLTTGYSDYGSLGQYTINGTIIPDPNNAPVLDSSGDMFLPDVAEDSTGSAGTLISDLIASAGGNPITDADVGAVEGIAVIAADASNGLWEYSINNGSAWSALGAVATTSARLLASNTQTRIRFTPNANFSGVINPGITFRAWDQTSGSNGGTASTSTNGDTTAFSTATETARITVTAINDAPVLDNLGNMALTDIDEDAFTNPGMLISALIASTGSDRISDADSGAAEGIAVIAANAANGVWEYSTDNGTNWTALGPVTTTSARLLASDSLTRIRFRPNADFNGTIGSAIAFHAWDQTAGSNGGTSNPTPNGGSTAFSLATESASLIVNNVNDAPVLDTAGDMVLSSILEDEVANPGTSIVDLLVSTGSDRIADVDIGAVEGIAVTGTDTTNGDWFYSLNGGAVWTALGVVSDAAARLLVANANTRIRFVPDANFYGTLATAITFRAWDRTGGTNNGATANTSPNGGATPYSTGTETARLVVTPVNDAPSFTAGGNQSVVEDSAGQSVPGWATNLLAGPADEAAQTFSFEVSNNNNALFSVQPAIDSSGALSYTPAANANGSATVSVRIKDNGGTVNDGDDTSNPQSFTITIRPVNDVPQFAAGNDPSVLEDSGSNNISGWATAISAGPTNESGQTLTFVVTTDNNALFGVLPAVSANGTLTFAPALNAVGTASVTVRLTDNGGTGDGGDDVSDPQTFAITIAPVNDAPTFVKGLDQIVDEDTGVQSISGWATNIVAGPPDEAAQTVTFEVVDNSNPALFAVSPSIGSDGTLSYTPAANANGEATIAVRAVDNGGTADDGDDTSSMQTFQITIRPANDAPTPQADSVTAIIGQPLQIAVLANDTDIDGDTLQLTSATAPPNGQVRREGNHLIYTTRLIAPGSDSFSYTISDGHEFATTTVSITVIDRVAAKIKSVRVYAGRTTYAEATSLNRTVLPWAKITSITIAFNEAVTVDQAALSLTDLNGGSVVQTSFSYDAATRTATWAPLTPIDNGRFTIRLDAAGVVDVSGNVLASNWSRSFGLLTGDYDGNGVVNNRDLSLIRRKFSRPRVARDSFADIDGNGIVNQTDWNLAFSKRGQRLG